MRYAQINFSVRKKTKCSTPKKILLCAKKQNVLRPKRFYCASKNKIFHAQKDFAVRPKTKCSASKVIFLCAQHARHCEPERRSNPLFLMFVIPNKKRVIPNFVSESIIKIQMLKRVQHDGFYNTKNAESFY